VWIVGICAIVDHRMFSHSVVFTGTCSASQRHATIRCCVGGRWRGQVSVIFAPGGKQ